MKDVSLAARQGAGTIHHRNYSYQEKHTKHFYASYADASVPGAMNYRGDKKNI